MRVPGGFFLKALGLPATTPSPVCQAMLPFVRRHLRALLEITFRSQLMEDYSSARERNDSPFTLARRLLEEAAPEGYSPDPDRPDWPLLRAGLRALASVWTPTYGEWATWWAEHRKLACPKGVLEAPALLDATLLYAALDLWEEPGHLPPFRERLKQAIQWWISLSPKADWEFTRPGDPSLFERLLAHWKQGLEFPLEQKAAELASRLEQARMKEELSAALPACPRPRL